MTEHKSKNGTQLYWCPDCHPCGGTWHKWKPEDCKYAQMNKNKGGQANVTKTCSDKIAPIKEKPTSKKKKDKVHLEMDRTALGFLDSGNATGFFNHFSHLTSQDFD